MKHMNPPYKQPPLNVRFETTAVSFGRCDLPDLDDVAEILATDEDEAFRSLLRQHLKPPAK